MQYLLNDLKKLPLKERLAFIELAINSFSMDDTNVEFEQTIMNGKAVIAKFQSAGFINSNYESKAV